METNRKHKMGRITIEVEIANNEDLVRARNGDMDSSKIRRVKIQGLVDSGAMRLVLPLVVVKELGLPLKKKKIRVRYADGRCGLRAEAEQVCVALLGRDGVFSAIVEPKRETALIGAIVLEDLDLLVDCANLGLMPRDPDYVLSEIG